MVGMLEMLSHVFWFSITVSDRMAKSILSASRCSSSLTGTPVSVLAVPHRPVCA